MKLLPIFLGFSRAEWSEWSQCQGFSSEVCNLQSSSGSQSAIFWSKVSDFCNLASANDEKMVPRNPRKSLNLSIASFQGLPGIF